MPTDLWLSDIQKELQSLLIGGDKREEMLNNYEQLHAILGNEVAHDNAARIMFKILNDKKSRKRKSKTSIFSSHFNTSFTPKSTKELITLKRKATFLPC